MPTTKAPSTRRTHDGPIPSPKGHRLWGHARDYNADKLGYLEAVRRDHGDVVRLNAAGLFRWVQIAHPDDVARVLGKNHRNYEKPPSFLAAVRPVFGNGLFTSAGAEWSRARKLITPPVSARRVLEKQIPLMARSIDESLASWEQHVGDDGAPLELLGGLTAITLRLTGFLFFGADLGARASAFDAALRDAFCELCLRMDAPVRTMLLPLWVPTPSNRRLRRATRRLFGIVRAIIAERRAQPDTGDDLLGRLLKARDEEGRALDDQQLADEVITLLIAGHDTTSAGLCWTLYLLATHPELREQAEAVADSAGGEGPVTKEDLARLGWLRQCFEEGLRLYPPAWLLPRQTVAEDILGGHPIPAGTFVLLSQWVTHRHPDFWEEPQRFDPDRFTPERQKARHPFAYFPFGGGPRVCVGRNLSLMEAPLVLAAILRRYRLKLVGEVPPVPDTTFTLRPQDGLPVRLERR